MPQGRLRRVVKSLSLSRYLNLNPDHLRPYIPVDHPSTHLLYFSLVVDPLQRSRVRPSASANLTPERLNHPHRSSEEVRYEVSILQLIIRIRNFKSYIGETTLATNSRSRDVSQNSLAQCCSRVYT